MPLVSIIIPCHRPAYLKLALSSALLQTYENIEIIVSDNSVGNDIENHVSGYKQVKYFKNSDKNPLTTARSNICNGLRYASGSFIKYLFDDDLLFPHTIDAMIKVVNVNAEMNIGLVTSYQQVIDSGNAVTEIRRNFKQEQPVVMSGTNIARSMLMHCRNFVGEFSAVLFDARFLNLDAPIEMFEYAGESFSWGLMDVCLYLQVLSKSNLLVVPYELSAFRVHEFSGSNASRNRLFHHAITDWLRLIDIAQRLGDLSKEELLQALVSYRDMHNEWYNEFPVELNSYVHVYNELVAAVDWQ